MPVAHRSFLMGEFCFILFFCKLTSSSDAGIIFFNVKGSDSRAVQNLSHRVSERVPASFVVLAFLPGH